MTVLWILLVITFISFALAAAVRVEVNSAGNSFDSERAIYLAKGAALALFQKVADPKAFADLPVSEEADAYVFQFESGVVRVKPQYSGGGVDLNKADEKQLAAMFNSLGVDESTRNSLVDSILDWRDEDDFPRASGAEINDYTGVSYGKKRLPANAPFSTLQEVLMVKNMTSEIYFGRLDFDASTNQYRKIPGLRDVATVGSDRTQVDVNSAPADVLSAVPGVSAAAAAKIVSARKERPFDTRGDLQQRVPELKEDGPWRDALGIKSGFPNVLISTATLKPSGVTKTVRLNLRTERGRTINPSPNLFIYTWNPKLGNWEY